VGSSATASTSSTAPCGRDGETFLAWARERSAEAFRRQEHDPAELFQSDWYRHYRAMFGAEVEAAA